MAKRIFVNLPIKDLDRTVKFFTALGFRFNPQFTDKNATCMIIGENIFAMLLVEDYFKTFIKKEIADAKKTTEVLNALELENRQEVDGMMEKALQAGAKEPRDAQDLGFMYNRAFEDLDGHIWEVFHMDMSKMPKQ